MRRRFTANWVVAVLTVTGIFYVACGDGMEMPDTCLSSSDCPVGERCINNECVPGTRDAGGADAGDGPMDAGRMDAGGGTDAGEGTDSGPEPTDSGVPTDAPTSGA